MGCVRGEIASEGEKEELQQIICNLEGTFSKQDVGLIPTMCQGRWELVYSSTYLFRSSPFFMAARAICNDGKEADRFDYFCKLHREALAFTSIGHVQQQINGSTLTSYFQSKAAVIPGLPFTVTGTIVSSADIESFEDNCLKLHMNTVKVEDSNLPIFRDFLQPLDSRALSRFLETTFPQ